MAADAEATTQRTRLTAVRLSPPTRRSLLRGLLAYRWLTLTWAAGAFAWEVWNRRSSDQPDVAHPLVGFALLGAAAGLTAAFTWLYRRDPDQLLRPIAIFSEIGVGTVMLLADTWVFGSADHPQTLPSVWVVAAVAGVAVAGGRRAAVVTGLGMGLARYVGLLIVESPGAGFAGLATMVLLGVSGWVLGYLLYRFQEAERSISAYRAREEVARTLHDGVLQTLAVIQRRSSDQELVTLARSQESELRHYLFDRSPAGGTPATDLASGLRAAALRAEQRYPLRVQVVLAPDLPAGQAALNDRLAAAVGEALTNSAKHGEAATATVFAEPADEAGVFVSVKDDGNGFDPAEVDEGQGLSQSIRGRLTEVGGRVEVDSRPGRGAEIRMWI